ncbi:Farnesyl diphosphate synthase [Lactobacillus helveticus]|uniref:polyprenyl synthetase family protein n=1 Tax=Lactobacillus helveticus TaxID=1587 RepID=UPI0015625E39|nr:polyprenyl synthetase family protein [Lactobacillus helveticus]NRO03198.1 Farnesyl diphosphate synthase [Lactobacillus helveticus]NRO37902.1 Farnesyl diphosphate synthase [Lactobacillus helveticus]NRO75225.1 Farnesyl diphosphate synthase [Lactobacillus helveticus]
MTAFKYFKEDWTPVIDDYLAKHLASEVDNQKISQIMAYSVMAGGKRLRPLLFLATLNTLGRKIDETEIRIACGIELIHTYSLIHDDLPAMDNDDYRRGKLTSHKKWGEAKAILAGDALLPLGIQWIAEGSQSAQLVNIITQAVGPNGMVGGQYRDIDSTNNASVAGDAKFINQMEWLKTGCLIQASVEMAAVYAKASDIEQVKLIDFAKAFGRSYQIYDDLVDVIETSEKAGKATHKDKEEGKNNTLTLLGIDQSRKELKDLIDQAKDDLHGLNGEVLAGFLDLYQKVL